LQAIDYDEYFFDTGFFCPALAKAVKTMKKGEKVLLNVKPECESNFCYHSNYVNTYFPCISLLTFLSSADAFGESGKPSSGNDGAVPPNASLQIDLELVSWKTVSDITKDRKVLKKTLNEGEGYERPNDGAVVQGTILLI